MQLRSGDILVAPDIWSLF